MAHYVLYKRISEVTDFDFDFTELLPETDTLLDTSKSVCKVVNSAGDDKTSYFLQSLTFNGMVATAHLVNGLEGEDYLVYFYGVGNVSQGKPTPNRILELRVRERIAGNL